MKITMKNNEKEPVHLTVRDMIEQSKEDSSGLVFFYIEGEWPVYVANKGNVFLWTAGVNQGRYPGTTDRSNDNCATRRNWDHCQGMEVIRITEITYTTRSYK